jgi:hypothetical protein
MPPRTHHAGKRAPGCAAKLEADAAARSDHRGHWARRRVDLHPFTRGNVRQLEKVSRVLPSRLAAAAAAPLLPGVG